MKIHINNIGTTTISLLIILVCSFKSSECKADFRFNQIGFYPNEEKIAIIDTVISCTFQIKQYETDKVVFESLVSAPRSSAFSNKKTVVLNFSKLSKPGKYYIEIPGIEKSSPFEIKKALLADLGKAALKAFYYQRSGTTIPQQYAGKWPRAFGHPDTCIMIHPSAATAKRPEGTIISSSKGWYDAGDYNKYIVNSGFTIGMILSLYEDYPEYTKHISVNIPESKNSTPDLLDEAWWNLEWMLTMQDPDDGGVYHKLSTPYFEGMVKPVDCNQQRYVIQKSVTASLDFAASMAQAARVFSAYTSDYPGASKKMLIAARKAFDWAKKHPDALYNQNVMNKKYKPEITTGGYEDCSAKDEFFWAACELYITTGDIQYLQTIKSNLPQVFTLPVWSNVNGLGVFSLIRHSKSMTSEGNEIVSSLKKQLLTYTDSCLKRVDQAAYAASYGRSAIDFFWGCNSDKASNQGIAFLYAYNLTKDKRYLTNALSNMDYILGRNATGYCYITGFGNKSPQNPHHRLAASDNIKEPLPGFLVGGPNPEKQDKCYYPSDVPDEAYIDMTPAYACNEIAINWQGMFTYFVMALNASIN